MCETNLMKRRRAIDLYGGRAARKPVILDGGYTRDARRFGGRIVRIFIQNTTSDNYKYRHGIIGTRQQYDTCLNVARVTYSKMNLVLLFRIFYFFTSSTSSSFFLSFSHTHTHSVVVSSDERVPT